MEREVTVLVEAKGLEELQEKAKALKETIKEAKSLAGDLTSLLAKIELKVKV